MSHDRNLSSEAVKNLIHLIGSNENGTHQNDRADVLFELLLEGEAIIEVDRLGCFPVERWASAPCTCVMFLRAQSAAPTEAVLANHVA